jgi:hypothetical protein
VTGREGVGPGADPWVAKEDRAGTGIAGRDAAGAGTGIAGRGTAGVETAGV